MLAGRIAPRPARTLKSFMTAGYLDTRVYALYDRIPALCYGPISQNIHGFDERVSLASVKRITGRDGAVHCRMVRGRAAGAAGIVLAFQPHL